MDLSVLQIISIILGVFLIFKLIPVDNTYPGDVDEECIVLHSDNRGYCDYVTYCGRKFVRRCGEEENRFYEQRLR